MKNLFRLTLLISILVVVGVGLVLLRYYQMEAGIKALKEDKGVVALEKLKPLAYLGYQPAQINIGLIYAYGIGGVPKDDNKAIYWFRRSGPIKSLGSKPEDGVDPAAPYELAVAKDYMNGTWGVKADNAESQKWLRLAAAGGNKEATALLIKVYSK